jgi:hypothetical protein
MPMNKPGPQSDSPWRHIVAAIGWIILAAMPLIVTAAGAAIYLVLTGRGISEDILDLLLAPTQAASYGIILSAAFLKGRSLGQGDARVGLGDGPISNRPIIVSMAVLLSAYTMLEHAAHPNWDKQNLNLADGSWRMIYAIFFNVMVAPLAGELFFEVGCGRGFEGTGALCQQPC